MKKRGVSRCAALLVMLLMMMSTAVMLPSQDATAQTHEIWGYVTTTNPFGPVEGALVSLTDVHGLDPSTNTVASGYYEFSVGSGFYELEVSMDGYFSQKYGPFRFDDTVNMRVDFSLEKTPALDYELTGTVLSSVTNQVTDELVEFTTHTITEENVTESWIGLTNTVGLGSLPIVETSYRALWTNGTVINLELTSGQYSLDLWSGLATILDPFIASDLDSETGWIRFTYDYADNVSSLDNTFITTYQANKSGTPWSEPGNYNLDVDTGEIEIIGDFIFGVDVLEFDYYYHPTIINGASLTIHNVTMDHDVSSDISDSSGGFILKSWAGIFELQLRADGYQPKTTSLQITEDRKIRVLMDTAILINGLVTDESGTSAVENVRAYMFCLDSVPESMKILQAETSGSYYVIDAFPGTFRLYVDADGYQAKYSEITVTADEVHNFSLSLSEEELFETSIGFVGDDWNEIAVYKNLTLNNDSHLPSLGTDPMGSLWLEIDWTVGDKDGSLSSQEWTNFSVWLEERGPQFLNTGGFFTTEQEEYTLKMTGYSVDVTYDNEHAWIETAAWYNTSAIELDMDIYDLNLNAAYDEAILIEGEDKILKNYTYWIEAPYGYELIWNSSMNTDVTGFTDIFIDPKKGVGAGAVALKLGKSEVGVAIAKIISPVDCSIVGYEELCTNVIRIDFEDYLAVIPAEIEINFSAEDSTDPNSVQPDNKISPHANFTWDFGDGTPLGYGIVAAHNYSDPGTGPGNYTVDLTIVEPGGNETNRKINVTVDAQVPHALVWFDEDDWTVKDSHLHINEDIEFNMGANLSSDEVWIGEEGTIMSWQWDHDSDGDPNAFTEKVDSDFFTEPGEYVLNLTVWDWVGHKSDNYSKTIYVDDVTPPEATYRVMDSNFVETNFPLEQSTVYFNASDTTDNFSTLENLTFEWTIEEGTTNGVNITHVFSEPGDYEISLKATDEAENDGYHNITLSVGANRSLHSHIFIPEEIGELDPLEFRPGSPEVGQSVKISVIVNNTDEGVEALNVTVRFWIVGDEDNEITGTVKYYDADGEQIFNKTIPVNGSIRAEISWKPGGHGEYTIKANCTADNEFPNTEGDNKIQEQLTVKEAGYVTPLIIGILVVLIFLIAIILLVRRKFGGRFPRRAKKEKKPEKAKKKRVKK